MSSHRVVIVGGGIAGIVTAMRLGRRLARGRLARGRLARRGLAQIMLVDHAPAHVWKPMLHTFASGTADTRSESVSFADHARRNGYSYLPGVFAGVDRANRTVRFDKVRLPDNETEFGGGTLPFDTLILAIGSRVNDFGTPGVAEHCHFIDDITQAEHFHDRLRAKALAAMAAQRDVVVAVVGGGATGVELVAELSKAKDILAALSPAAKRPQLRLTLIESGPRLLATMPERVSNAASAKLRDLGIAVVLDAKVVAAHQAGFTLANGRVIEADLPVWTAGIKSPSVLAGIEGLETSQSQQLIVRPTLQTSNDPAIFAIGDCASLAGRDGKPIPATAQAARQQTMFLARSFSANLRTGRPLRSFEYRDFGSVVALGGYTAYATLARHRLFPGGFIEGRMAALGHAALYRAHQLDLNGLVRGGGLWLADALRRSAQPSLRLD